MASNDEIELFLKEELRTLLAREVRIGGIHEPMATAILNNLLFTAQLEAIQREIVRMGGSETNMIESRIVVLRECIAESRARIE
jgi:hypothetical protein